MIKKLFALYLTLMTALSFNQENVQKEFYDVSFGDFATHEQAMERLKVVSSKFGAPLSNWVDIKENSYHDSLNWDNDFTVYMETNSFPDFASKIKNIWSVDKNVKVIPDVVVGDINDRRNYMLVEYQGNAALTADKYCLLPEAFTEEERDRNNLNYRLAKKTIQTYFDRNESTIGDFEKIPRKDLIFTENSLEEKVEE